MKSFKFLHRKRRSKRKHYIELDPRRYWIILLSVFVLGIALELVYFSLVFLKTSKNIDAPATPTLETNAGKIKSINKDLTGVENSINQRTGSPTASSEEKELKTIE